MNLPLAIARRLQFRPEPGRALSPGIVIATTGIAVAIVVMLLTIAIITGFKHQIRAKVTGFDSQIIVTSAAEGTTLDVAAARAAVEPLLPEGAVMTDVMVRPAVLKTDDDFAGLVFNSVGANADFIAANVVEGSLPADTASSGIALSRMTASKLGLALGDRPMIYFVETDGSIRTRRQRVEAIFDTHFGDYDRRMAYAPASVLRKVARVSLNEADALTINGISDADVEPLTVAIDAALVRASAVEGMEPATVDNIHRRGAMYLNWLSLLDTNVVVILVLMALVLGFTLVSSTFIIILERVSTIGILKTLGMTDGAIRRIFIYMALKLVGLGLLIGNVVGLGLIALQAWLEVVPLNPEAYFLDCVPVEISIWQVLLLNAGVVVVAAAMLVLPTRVVCRMSPAETSKYE